MNRHLVKIVLPILMLAGCGSIEIQRINPNYEKDLAVLGEPSRMNQIIDSWFACDECVSGQLRRIQEYGNSALPRLTEAYNGNYFTPAVVTNLEIKYNAKCQRINNRIIGRGQVPPETCDQYVARAIQSEKRKYFLRAEEALLAIRTEMACGIVGDDRCNSTDPFAPIDHVLSTPRSTRYTTIDP